LHYNENKDGYVRIQNKRAALINIYNSQNKIGKFNEV
jgi:hypothetical protein